jgi:hypothetical protein
MKEEYQMHRYRVWLLAAVLCLAIAAPAAAWEFLMDGAFTWEWDYRTQGGGSGFFGPYDQDAGSGIPGAGAGFFAPLNGWLGEHAGNNTNGGIVSGSDASWNVFYMSTNMELRMNRAVRVRGNYYIGEWAPTTAPDFIPNIDFGIGSLVASQNLNSRSSGIQRSFSPGYWNTLWMTAETPWGIFALGKRKSVFGMGMYYNGEESRSSESFSLTVPYGPLRFGMSTYPARRASTGSNYPLPAIGSGAPPFNTTGYYNQDFDKNNGRWWDSTLPSVTYRNGPFETGFLFNPLRFTQGGEGIINTSTTRQTTLYTERTEVYGVWYMKYNNGRFFFNAELDWDHQTNRNRQKTAGGGQATQSGTNAFGQPVFVTDTFIENWRAVAEGGVLCGPAKLSLISAWAAGPDRRAGRQIDRTGLVTAAGRATDGIRRPSSFANTGVFRPYSLLMVYDYGLGTHINGDTGNGYVEDAMVYGARLDYAVASNLNTYLSFFWADRVSKSGFGWGFIKPVRQGDLRVATSAGTTASGTVGTIVIPAGTQVIFHDTTASGAPSIPDTNLGWEIDAGFDWKLLEGLTVNFSSAYWQPGQWFSWACVDKTIPGWATAAAATSGNNPLLWHVNPNKQIDPIFGIELKVTGDF